MPFKDIEKQKEYLREYKKTDTYKDYFKINVICDCGSKILFCQLPRHFRTIKHNKYITPEVYNY